MQFRANSDALQLGGTGSSMPGEVSPAGLPSGFDQGLQAMPAPYHPMQGRADKHASNIVGSGQHFGAGGIQALHGK